MMIPIPFYGWLSVDQEDTETMLREQIHAQQAEIKALRTALMYKAPKEITPAKARRGRKVSEQTQQDIDEIVEFYLRHVTDYRSEIAEHLEYFWKCMNDYSIADYLQIVRERKEQQK